MFNYGLDHTDIGEQFLMLTLWCFSKGVYLNYLCQFCVIGFLVSVVHVLFISLHTHFVLSLPTCMYSCLLKPRHLGQTACIHHRFELVCLSLGVGRSILHILATLYTMNWMNRITCMFASNHPEKILIRYCLFIIKNIFICERVLTILVQGSYWGS